MSIEAPASHRSSRGADDPMIVGVACSVEDIAAPSELVAALPAGCDLALYFVPQPSEDRPQRLGDALRIRTSMPVTEACHGGHAEHGHIYVIPRNCVARLTQEGVRLSRTADKSECPADVLLTSLAGELGGKSIGVVLSGGGSELAAGIRAIRQAGGATFAQYPGSARFPSLPISAIETGCVDFVLRPNEIAQQLARIAGRIDTDSSVAPIAGLRQWRIRPPEAAGGLADPRR